MDQPNTPAGGVPPQKPGDVTFNVMPQEGKSFAESVPAGRSVPQSAPPPSGPLSPNLEPHDGGSGRKWIYIIVGIVVLFAAGGLAYYMLGTKTEEPVVAGPVSALSKEWMSKYFNKEVCDDQVNCGDKADPDNDGLTNVLEFKANTNPLNPDTDVDGLADGDEVRIYKTEPTLKYTDRREIVAQNNWTDGFQIKGGFDPLTPGIKFTSTRLQQIADATTAFHLHEPSISTTTMAPIPPPAPTGSTTAKTVAVTIQNGKFVPATVTVKVGDTIIWTNKDTVPHYIASDPHPTHTGLPGLDSSQLTMNQSFSFILTKTGTFGYHDHLNPTVKGTIVVNK